ncbi:MAG: O-antigen polymerase [Verrucomicrobiales bacterium]|nr:O-antigen polymerase [Verrucomicrobiales bacterium]
MNPETVNPEPAPQRQPENEPASGRVRRRRRRENPDSGSGRSGHPEWPRDGDGDGIPWKSGAGLIGMAAIALFAMLVPGTEFTFLHGMVCLFFGLLVTVFPPAFRISGFWLLAGVLLLAGCSAGLLPREWFGVQAWRTALEPLGVETGSKVSPQPLISLQLLGCLAVSVLAAWYVSGQRIADRLQLPLALGIALGIALYGTVSMLAYQARPAWSWDPVPTFGLYGNRNHTATVLTMGGLISLGVILESMRGKRGGVAGLATLSLVICAWGLLGYSVSRAGVLLFGTGILAWGCLLGRRYISLKVLGGSLALLTVAIAIFWSADTALKHRLEEQWGLMKAKAEAAAAAQPSDSGNADTGTDAGPEEPPAGVSTTDTMGDQPLDFRQFIYRDTLRMIGKEPPTGVGLGQFGYVFPQYRHESLAINRCWHPESNWLLLAAEAGWPAVVVTALAVGGFFVAGFRAARRLKQGWAVALATLLAAVAVPVHGIFDVPAYHVGIAWTALVLVMTNFRAVSTDSKGQAMAAQPSGRLSRWMFRAGGVAVMAAGAWLLTQWVQNRHLPMDQASAAADGMRALFAADAAEKQDPENNPPMTDADGKPVDRLEVAKEMVTHALRTTPLEPQLYFLRGSISMNFTDEEPVSDLAFTVQRHLLPDWVDVPYWQGAAWITTDAARSWTLWREALRRSRAAEQIRPGVYWSPERLVRMITIIVRKMPEQKEAFDQFKAEALKQP